MGSPQGVYNSPASTYIGWFLGEPGKNFAEVAVSIKMVVFY
jgi:ABC-type sugar transport system ATPase subunit